MAISPGYGHEVLSEWKLAKESDGIQISYRDIMVGDTFKTREMRIAFTIEAEVKQIIPMFNDPVNFAQWSAGIEKCELLNKDSTGWTMYNLYDAPWPFKQRDLVTEYVVAVSDSLTTLLLSGEPDRIPPTEGIMRMEQFEGYWTFEQTDSGITIVEFHSIAFSKPIVPRFIQDPILQRTLVSSMIKLTNLLRQ